MSVTSGDATSSLNENSTLDGFSTSAASSSAANKHNQKKKEKKRLKKEKKRIKKEERKRIKKERKRKEKEERRKKRKLEKEKNKEFVRGEFISIPVSVTWSCGNETAFAQYTVTVTTFGDSWSQ